MSTRTEATPKLREYAERTAYSKIDAAFCHFDECETAQLLAKFEDSYNSFANHCTCDCDTARDIVLEIAQRVI